MWRFETASATPGPVETLNDFVGRQTWRFDESAASSTDDAADRRAQVEAARTRFAASAATQKHSSDELLRQQCMYAAEKEQGEPPLLSTPEAAAIAASRRDPTDHGDVRASLAAGASYFARLQQSDGHWAGDYGGPMFLLPGMLIACHVTGVLEEVFPTKHHTEEALRYLTLHQNPDDGGFGLHIEGHSTMVCTVLNYVSMRILGLKPEDERCARARRWIRARGGATRVASWGKFWLAVLGCYSWAGVNPMPPEAWLLPHAKWTGIGWIHPGRYWCHCRMVYLPMSYLFGARVGGCGDASGFSPLVAELRGELFTEAGGFASVDWDAARNKCAEEDVYYPHPKVRAEGEEKKREFFFFSSGFFFFSFLRGFSPFSKKTHLSSPPRFAPPIVTSTGPGPPLVVHEPHRAPRRRHQAPKDGPEQGCGARFLRGRTDAPHMHRAGEQSRQHAGAVLPRRSGLRGVQETYPSVAGLPLGG